MKKIHVLTIVAILISGTLFYLINLLTVPPGTTSGNGNPAILLMFPLPPLFLLITYGFYREAKLIKERLYLPILLAIPLYWIIGIYYQIQSFQVYKQKIYDENLRRHGDSVGLEEYVDQITTGISIHVNNQYFNLNTFIMFISAALLIAILNRRRSNRNAN